MIRARRALAALGAALTLVALAAGSARAQLPTGKTRRPPRTSQPPGAQPGRPGAQRAPGDTSHAPGDTTHKDLVKWAPDDSVMQALEQRPGYVVTKYQGNTVLFEATSRALTLQGGPAAVARDQALLVGDTLVYDDSLQTVLVRGDTVFLRDPTQGSDDVIAHGSLTYDLATRHAVVTRVSTSIDNGQRWFLNAARGGFRSDTATNTSTFYGRDGSITSCDSPIPDYHFQVGELKMINRSVIVARPATLYIGDVPVMWLPFLFQTIKQGRHSGLLIPRIGLADIVRTNPGYRRTLEDLGYYFALSDYADLSFALDWRSSARATSYDPGYIQYNGEFRYNWLDRFVSGTFASNLRSIPGQSRFFNVYWSHAQQFSSQTSLHFDLNYSSNTTLQRATTINPFAALATIRSNANYQTVLGPLSLNVGGTRTQYTGRDQVDQNFPNLNISPRGPINLASWLTWTPTFSFSNSQSLHLDQLGTFAYRYRPNALGGIDSSRFDASQRNTSINFSTPLKIFEYNLSNTFAITDQLLDYPQTRHVYYSGPTDTVGTERTVARTFRTNVDWTPSFSLPSFSPGRWNLTPSVSLSNVSGEGAFWVRTERTGGNWVHQGKRPVYGLGISPTFFGLFPGFGPVSRFRHSINTSLSYSYAPAAQVDQKFLDALGIQRTTSLAGIRQNNLSLNISQNIEAKLKARGDTSDAGTKVKLLSIQTDALSYNFEQYREVKRRSANPAAVSPWAGLTSSRFSYTLRSDLLPSFSFRSGYSLFQGNNQSDTARFKPYREEVSASFSVGRGSSLLALMSRIFGRTQPVTAPNLGQAPNAGDAALAQQVAGMAVAGSASRNSPYALPTNGANGWQASFTFSSTRQRPPVGGTVVTIDPRTLCNNYLGTASYDICYNNAVNPPASDTTLGGSSTGSRFFTRTPPRTTLQSTLGFNITPLWAANWSTTYDFEAGQFASHVVSLQRDLHDWRAIFAFTQSPNGAFAFNFFISLKADPNFKFNYDRRSYRNGSGFSTQ